jgi:hypothetical protein
MISTLRKHRHQCQFVVPQPKRLYQSIKSSKLWQCGWKWQWMNQCINQESQPLWAVLNESRDAVSRFPDRVHVRWLEKRLYHRYGTSTRYYACARSICKTHHVEDIRHTTNTCTLVPSATSIHIASAAIKCIKCIECRVYHRFTYEARHDSNKYIWSKTWGTCNIIWLSRNVP